MIIFLYGSDSYRLRQKLNEIIDYYKKIHQSGLNLKFFDCQEISFLNFKEEIQQISIIKGKKLAILKNLFSDSDFKEKFLENGKDFKNSENLILISEEKSIPENDLLFQFLIKNSKFQEFKPLEGIKLISWVKREFNKYKVEIEPKALKLLIDYVGNDLWQMSNEIKKLASYKSGHKLGERASKIIKENDIQLLVGPKIETDIFRTIDAISEKKKSQALTLLHQHLEKGDSPFYLLTMINFQFRNLLTIKELMEKDTPYYKIINNSHLHPFIIKKSYQQAKKFTFPQLKKIYQKIFEIDLYIKIGKIEPETALDLLIAEI